MTIHDSSFNTYTYIHVCIIPIWDKIGVLYVCLVLILQIIMVVVEEFFVRMEDEDEDEGGVASRLAPGGVGSVRSVSIGSRIGSRVFRGRIVRTVCWCITCTTQPPIMCGGAGMDGWNAMECDDDDGMG